MTPQQTVGNLTLTEAEMPETLTARKELIESHLDDLMEPCAAAEGGRVREAMRYAVLGQGQRIRPLLALSTADMLGCENHLTLRAALSVELLHCASLIVDDLPSMDDEPLRRNRPSTHVVFGEPVALLAAFSLVALAARSVLAVRCSPREVSRLIEFQQDLLKVLDCDSLVGGQALDLELTGAKREARRQRMNELKTAPLFLLAVKAGAINARLSPDSEQRLARFGREFGVAFQATDDFLDDEISDLAAVTRAIENARSTIGDLRVEGRGPHLLLDYLYAKACEKDHCYR